MIDKDLHSSIEAVVGRLIEDEDDARKALQDLLRELGVPCDSLSDITMLLETAVVLTNNQQHRRTPIELKTITPETHVKQVHDHWLTYYIGEARVGSKKKAVGGETDLLYPRYNVDDRKPFQPLIDVLLRVYPHLRILYLSRGVTIINGTSAILAFDRTHEFKGEVLGWLHLNAFSFETGEQELRKTLPPEFLAPRRLWWAKGMRRWTIAPVSLKEVIELATNFEVGLSLKEFSNETE